MQLFFILNKMNLTLFYSYLSFLKYKPSMLKRVKKSMPLFFFQKFIEFLILVNNEHSIFSLLVLNYCIWIGFYNKNILKNFYRFFLKKEVSFSRKEVICVLISTEFYKNFNHWNNLNWFNKKESSGIDFVSAILIFKIKMAETKNFHNWGENLDFLFSSELNTIEKILLLDVISSLENFNHSNWNFNHFFLIKMKTVKTDFFSFFLKVNSKISHESKWEILKKLIKNLNDMSSFELFVWNFYNFF